MGGAVTEWVGHGRADGHAAWRAGGMWHDNRAGGVQSIGWAWRGLLGGCGRRERERDREMGRPL
jgi:hypothetical protein